MGFSENINRQIEELNRQISKLNNVNELVNEFPDIKETSDRWNKKYYISSQVNAIATNVRFKYACGCCNDSLVLAFFYIIRNGIEVYADPQSIRIGEQNISGYGDHPDGDWKENLIKHHINPELFCDVEKYFIDNEPRDCEDNE